MPPPRSSGVSQNPAPALQEAMLQLTWWNANSLILVFGLIHHDIIICLLISDFYFPLMFATAWWNLVSYNIFMQEPTCPSGHACGSTIEADIAH